MNTVAAATHPPPPSPYHHHLPPQSQPISIHTQKSILDLLNSKSTPSSLSQIHALILKTGHFHDHFVSGTLLKSYANHSLDYALQIFHHVPSPNVFVYNVLIKSCLDNSHPRKAISLYCQLTANGAKPNKFTYTPLLKACGDFSEGMQIHGHVVKLGLCGDWHIKSAGIRMYGRFGKVGEARKVFDEMPERNVGSWNAVVSGLAKCGRVEEAREVFDEMVERDEISWSGLIDGYIRGGFYKEGLEVFVRMQREGVELSKFALTSVLAACAHLGALDHGRWIHAYVKKKRKSSLVMDPTMATALLDMYAKCGRLDMAWEVFESLKEKEVFTWNAMIGGMAMHGRAEDAVELFIEMLRRKFRPNEITFVGVLNACAHSGDVDRAMQIFDSMERFHGIVPGVEHYGCLVHGLARAGRLEEAEELVDSMPMEPNAAVWGALLGGCRIHGNMEIGERAGKILLEMDPDNSGRYALLSNIYAKAERWDDVVNVRKLMKERGVKTIAGSSMIDLGGCVHEFKMGEGSHPQMKDIYSMLKAMIERLTIEGYVPDTSQVLFDIEEEEKETALQYHSEKLAIAFGFINTKPGTTIRVVKNLRVCDDCHSAIKLISRVYGRDIILRDRVRYHHFRNGACSCKDFW
ncbi:Pentatricopeptide repeat-containing protein At5g66520 [Linum perenne]